MNKDIIKIKKDGHLIAISKDRQYWLKDGTIYSAHVSGLYYDIWCIGSRLDYHLMRLYQIHGYKYFSGDPNKVIINTEFLRKHIYA